MDRRTFVGLTAATGGVFASVTRHFRADRAQSKKESANSRTESGREMLKFLARQGIPFDQFRARQPTSIAIN